MFFTYCFDHSYETRVKCKIGFDGGLSTWISAKPTDWTPEVNYHISWKMAENSVLCGELRAPRCPGFYRLVLPALHRYRRTMKNYCVSSNNTKWEYEWTSTRRLVTNPVTGWGRIHTHFLKDRNCEMQEGENHLDSTQETHRWSHTSSSKIWENW